MGAPRGPPTQHGGSTKIFLQEEKDATTQTPSFMTLKTDTQTLFTLNKPRSKHQSKVKSLPDATEELCCETGAQLVKIVLHL